MFLALKTVFQKKLYLALASGVAFITLLFSIYLPNFSLLQKIISSSVIGTRYKLHFLWSLVGGIQTNTTPFSAFYIVGLSILFGINIAMIWYMIRRNRKNAQVQGAALATSGFIMGILGIGCAACGSLILTPILVSIGAAGLLAFLPLRGGEFGLLGMVLIGFSIFSLSKKINAQLVCEV